MEVFCDGLKKFTQFQSFKELVTLTISITDNFCSVSSIEFDKYGEFFAVVGAAKKIKVMFVRYQTIAFHLCPSGV